MSALDRAFGWFVRALQVIGQIVLAFMVITICYDAIMRYVSAAPTSWSLEVNTFLIVYIAVMTAADMQRSDGHIRITFFSDMMGPGMQRLIRALIGIIGVVFCAVLAWRGGLMTWQAWEYGERVSSSLGTPMFLPYAMLPVGFGALAIQFLIDVLKAIWAKDTSDPGDEQHQAI